MIRIQNKVIKRQPNFWSTAVFHPTDAIEDPWGKRILDRISKDRAIHTVRIYTMFEDIVYVGEDGELCYDFRLSDLRLDYMLDKGFDLLLAYGGIPDCIASSTSNKTSVSKNKTRYKGKMWNTAPPKDYALWEEICYTYTKHIVERYGIETVSRWYLQCFNEPDLPNFLLSEYPNTPENAVTYRLPVYCQLYEAFVRGICRVSEQLKLGGPSLAGHNAFLDGWLGYVKKKDLRLDFISVHNYGTAPRYLNEGIRPFDVQNNIRKHEIFVQTVKAHGMEGIPLFIDEWGMSASGFYNREECPALMAREHEMFSAYFVKLIHELAHSSRGPDMLAICLSGQHEMVEDFSGFRNFFTLHFIAKPIYNAHILANKLGDRLLAAEKAEKNLYLIPTKNEAGDYAVLLSYSSEHFEEDIPTRSETVIFEEDIAGKTVTIWCMDQTHTNPCRMWERAGKPEMTEDFLKELREEGTLKPIRIQKGSDPITLSLPPNATYLITVTE